MLDNSYWLQKCFPTNICIVLSKSPKTIKIHYDLVPGTLVWVHAL